MHGLCTQLTMCYISVPVPESITTYSPDPAIRPLCSVVTNFRGIAALTSKIEGYDKSWWNDCRMVFIKFFMELRALPLTDTCQKAGKRRITKTIPHSGYIFSGDQYHVWYRFVGRLGFSSLWKVGDNSHQRVIGESPKTNPMLLCTQTATQLINVTVTSINDWGCHYRNLFGIWMRWIVVAQGEGCLISETFFISERGDSPYRPVPYRWGITVKSLPLSWRKTSYWITLV